MTTDNEPGVVVTQGDKDLLAAFYLMIDWIEAADGALSGDCLTSDEQQLLERIARHRIATEAACREREAELVEALRAEMQQVANRLRELADEDKYGPRWRPLHYSAGQIEAALARAKATTDATGEG